MVESQLENLLKQFETYFKCSLVADENQSCLIKLRSGIELQIELNRYGLILIGCKLGQVIGRYQDLVLKQALKANYLQSPSTGIFGFSRKSSQLIIFKLIDPLSITPHETNMILDPLLAKAKIWNESIKNNGVPLLSINKETSAKNLFKIL